MNQDNLLTKESLETAKVAFGERTSHVTELVPLDQKVNLKDLADKFKLTKDERAQGVAAVKATQRNTLCPCGCGKKAKKCQNGRTVLQFKKLLRGSVMSEVFLFIFAVFIITLIWGSVKKNMAKDCGESIVIQKTVYTDTTGFDGEIVNGTVNTLQSKP